MTDDKMVTMPLFGQHLNTQQLRMPDIFSKLERKVPSFKKYSRTRVINATECSAEAKRRGITGPAIPYSFISELKSSIIQETLAELAQEIEADYIQESTWYNKPLDNENFFEDVPVDFTFVEMTPGDTSLGFEIYTVRCLRKR